jgi:antitoxin Phd
MASYSLTELGNKSGEVAEAAFLGPVNITSRGKRKFVLLTAADFDRIAAQASKRRAVHVDDLTGDQAAAYIAGLSDYDRDDV